MREFIFTFGFGHTDPVTGESRSGCFTRIAANDMNQARERMAARFGRQWAFQYQTEAEAGVAEFSLREISESNVPAELEAILEEIYKPGGVRVWWGGVNLLLDKERPVDVWRTDPDRVLQIAHQLADGAYV